MSHDRSTLSAGTRVRAADFPPAVYVSDFTGQDNVTTTTYTSGTPQAAVRFRGPTSGRVAVHLGAGLRSNSATTDRLFVTFEIYTGDPSDDVIHHAAEVRHGVSNHAVSDANDDYSLAGHLTLVDGLEPGQWYFLRVIHRSTLGNGVADLVYRSALVFPVP